MKMAVEKLEIETYFGKCKCCLKFGYLRPMWDEHEDENEAYGKMLTQCFSIPWTIESSEEEDQICEDCIWKLQEANKFKQQILQSQTGEQKFVAIEIKNEGVKAEPEETYDVEYLDEELLHKNHEETDTNEQNGESDVDYVEEIEMLDDDIENDDVTSYKYDLDEENDDEDDKESIAKSVPRKRTPRTEDAESETDTSKPKWPKKLPLQERWKTYRQYTDEDMMLAVNEVMNKTMNQRQAALKFNVPVKTLGAKIRAIKNLEESDETRGDYEAPAVIQKHRENIQSVLAYSNATPIRGFWGKGYVCSICPQQYDTPSDLKIHSQKHEHLPQLFKINHVNGHIARLDITGLKCKLCNTKFEKLQSLMQHLKRIHGKPMHFDIDNHMVPFKFDSKLLHCPDCTESFEHCQTLSEHMADKHYRNYICNECNKGFFNISHLLGHKETHQSGEFRCSECGKVFTTLRKKSKHERLHATRGKNYKCQFCELRFYNISQRSDHELKMHPNAKIEFDCSYCEKTYSISKLLKIHINEVHLDPQKHECPVKTCKKSFYLKRTLKAHIKEHDLKRFQCPECFKMFKLKDTMKCHLTGHTERERKFRCEECDVSYLKKDNLNRHMKKHH